MTGTHKPNPTNWDEYQYGTAVSPRGSVSSMGGRSVRFSEDHGEETHLLAPSEDDGNGGNLRRRRSSVALRLGALAEVGGVNSIRNFAQSWTRAAGFAEVVPHRPSFVLDDEQDHGDQDEQVTEYGRQDVEHGRRPRMSLIRAHLEASGSPEDAIDDEPCSGDNEVGPSEFHKDSVSKRLGSEMASTQGSVRGRESIFAIAPHLATPLAGSYGTSYGTLHSTLSRSSMQRAGQLWREQQAEAVRSGDGDRQPTIVKEIEQDGKIVLQIEGQSTFPQTIFNSTNVLIGVGLLSLPMGIKYSGWICGSIFLLLAALVTAYTAKLLAKCMDVDVSLMGFADLAFISFGQKARVAVSVLFFMELLAACVALVVLFSDTLHLLIPSVGGTEWKIICGLFLIPLSFVPLKLLSFSSVLGIFSCFSIVTIVFIDGFIKPHAPGSLRDPATTYLFPNNWMTLPLSFGLLMSPWGGHSVFPNIYRDMRHPHKFSRSVKYTFSFTYFLDAFTMVAGYLMFGDGVLNELTANILDNTSYPKSLSVLICIFIAIIPLTKIPLNGRPIVSMIDRMLGIEAKTMPDAPALTGMSNYSRGILKALVRVFVVIMFVIIAILFPAFDSIMAFMGSALCFTICIILPIMFYLKIFGKEISARERIFCIFLVAISSVLALVGTVFAFLPKNMIGAE